PSLPVELAAARAERDGLPDMPERTRVRYCVLGLTPAEATRLLEEPGLGAYFDLALASLGGRGPGLAPGLCGWVCVELLGRVSAAAPAATLADAKVAPAAL